MTKPRVLIAGAYTCTDAYPNVKYRIQKIKEFAEISSEEFNAGTPKKVSYRTNTGQALSLLSMALSLMLANIRALIYIVRRKKNFDTVYIPYPAIPLLWLISLLPNTFRPRRVVADVFISLYDTVVIDRNILAKKKWPARILWRIERRALSVSSISMTDTPENSHYYSQLFDIDPERFSDIPLSIVRDHFFPCDHNIEHSRIDLKVLFIGTLVPLHGIEILCQAIEMLDKESHITFTFVGNGQQASVLDEFLKCQLMIDTNIECHWIKEWQDSRSLAKLVHDTDICVGILNPKGKSQRVWPFKNYLYMACGRPLVTTRSPTSMRLAKKADYPAFFEVDTNNPEPLANLFRSLIEDRAALSSMGQNSRQFYDSFLSDEYIKEKLMGHLRSE